MIKNDGGVGVGVGRDVRLWDEGKGEGGIEKVRNENERQHLVFCLPCDVMLSTSFL